MKRFGLIEYNLARWNYGDVEAFEAAAEEVSASYVVCPLDPDLVVHMGTLSALADRFHSKGKPELYGIIYNADMIETAKHFRLHGLVLSVPTLGLLDEAARRWSGPISILTERSEYSYLSGLGGTTLILDPRGEVPLTHRTPEELQFFFATALKLGFGAAIEYARAMTEFPEVWRTICNHPWRKP